MSTVQMLRAAVEQRLTAAAVEIFGLFERTIAGYEEDLCRSKQENERQQRLLDAVFKPELRLHRADVQQQPLVRKEEVPPQQQEWSSSLDQEDPEPPHVKEEQKEVWTSQEGEEEANITKFPVTPVPVNSEDGEKKPQSSQLHQRHTEQMETEADGEDCGGPEPARNSDPDRHLQPDTGDKAEDSDADWKETREPQSGSKCLKNDEVPVSDSRCSAGEKSFSGTACGKRFVFQGRQRRHVSTHTDVQQLLVSKEEVPFPSPEPPHVKEEREGVWTSQEGEEEANITKFPVTPVPVNSEDDEKKPQSSQLHQRHTGQKETEADGEDCGGPEPARNSDPDRHLQPDTGEKAEDSDEPETEDSDDDWKETREPQSGSKCLKNGEVPVSDSRCSAGDKSFSGTACGKRFVFQGSQGRHVSTHTGKKRFSCSNCDKTFTWIYQLKRHKCVGRPLSQLHPSQTENRKGEPSASSSTVQMETRANGCGGPQPARNSDFNDLRCSAGEKPFSCSECGKRFRFIGDLQSHMLRHTGEKTFGCSECDQRFTTKGSLKRHVSIHTGEKPFSCACGQRFRTKASLNTHMMNHTGERPFSCSECGQRCRTKGNLESHMRVHTGEKSFSCSECGKRFDFKRSLHIHMRSHTGEKLLRCSECGKRFSTEKNLKRHMAIHTGEKLFSCSECGKRFITKAYLMAHMRVHAREKPFSCSLCGKGFTQKSSVTRHMKVHT